ncbi:MAG: hypothetical protein JWM37_558 [Candidatus Saccharibacteria bacterium]|nr:hypothetical protein [Candidatus Saccharibacteria bacterium]
MKKTVKTLQDRTRRQDLLALFVIIFSAVSIAAMLAPKFVSAAQVTVRSITMSDSSPSGSTSSNGNTSVGTGTNVTYRVKFTAATTGTIKGIVISFCDNTPFVADPSGCSAITGFSLSGVTATNTSGLSTGTWTVATDNGGAGAANHVFKYTNSTAATSTAANSVVEFTINGVTNPSTTNHSFYGRIITYASDTNASAYTDAANGTGTHIDDGGIALSTANNIQITAKVQETLIFCVANADIAAANCAGTLIAPDLTLGHGTNLTLDSSQVDYGSAYSQVSSNALSGVAIRVRNSNVCGGLSRIDVTLQTPTTGCDIPAVNNNTGGTTPTASATLGVGVAGFGMNALTPATGAITGSSGTLAYESVYDGTTNTRLGMNTTNDNGSHPGVSSTYGDLVASSSGPLNNIKTTYTFGAQASNITPAGIYKATMMLIATGTF